MKIVELEWDVESVTNVMFKNKSTNIKSFSGLRNQHENTALVKVEGCANKDDSAWYVGKKCAYVYRVSVSKYLWSRSNVIESYFEYQTSRSEQISKIKREIA